MRVERRIKHTKLAREHEVPSHPLFPCPCTWAQISRIAPVSLLFLVDGNVLHLVALWVGAGDC
jgi:hypothetical protein